MGMLYDIGLKFNADKATYHKYMDFYEHFFLPIRYDVRNVIEIGVDVGTSIKVWLEYFPNATIYGLDSRTMLEVPKSNRFKYISGKSALSEEVYSLFKEYEIDIIIDDGSHLTSDQQQAIKLYWSKVKPGGYFIIEDLHTSFDGYHVNKLPSTYDFLINNIDTDDIYLNNLKKTFNHKKYIYNRDQTFTNESSITCVIQK